MDRFSSFLRSYTAHGRHSMLIAFGDLFISLLGMIISLSNLYTVPPKTNDYINFGEKEKPPGVPLPFKAEVRGEYVGTFVVALIGATFAIILGIGILKRYSRMINTWIIANMIIISMGFIFLLMFSFVQLPHDKSQYEIVQAILQGYSAVIYRALQCWSVQEWYWEIASKRAILVEEGNSMCINCEAGLVDSDRL